MDYWMWLSVAWLAGMVCGAMLVSTAKVDD